MHLRLEFNSGVGPTCFLYFSEIIKKVRNLIILELLNFTNSSYISYNEKHDEVKSTSGLSGIIRHHNGTYYRLRFQKTNSLLVFNH